MHLRLLLQTAFLKAFLLASRGKAPGWARNASQMCSVSSGPLIPKEG